VPDPLIIEEVRDTSASTAAYAASLIAKAGRGRAFAVFGYNSKGSAQFLQLHDSATLPADTAVPAAVITVPTLANFSFPLPPNGMDFLNGITVSNSSTGPTKTIGSADCFITVLYR